MTRDSGLRDEERVDVLVAGGGTGGHVYPGLAIAEELVARGRPRSTIRFVGTARGLEATAVPDAGFRVELLPGRGLQRRFTVANLRAAWQTVVATVRAFRLVGRLRPRVVVGLGGYASLPTIVAARLRRIPVVVHEQNAAPGLANRIATRLGARAAVSLPGTPLRGAVLTGNPVRAEIVAVERAPDAARPLLAVFGGSLGARRINDAALGLYGCWRGRDDLRVHHVSGPRDFERCSTRLDAIRSAGDALEYRLVRYEEHMEQLYAAASLALCRSGAVTVAELAAAGVPAVLVPFPAATADHQTANARSLAAAGAAVSVPDEDCDVEAVEPLLSSLLGAPDRLEGMGSAARGLARPDAAARVADLVEERRVG